MEGEKSSSGILIVSILLILIVGGLVLFISSKMFYTKSNVDTLLEDVGCEYVDFSGVETYMGETPNQICANMNKDAEILFVRDVVTVHFAPGDIIYKDENYQVDMYLFDEPLGMAENLETTYGNPSGGRTGEINRRPNGVLCC